MNYRSYRRIAFLGFIAIGIVIFAQTAFVQNDRASNASVSPAPTDVSRHLESNSGSFFGLRASTDVAPAPPDLSSKIVKLNPVDFEKGSSTVPTKEFKTVPFTPDEVRKTGSPRIVKCGDKICVHTKTLNPATNNKLIPIEEYAAQLTKFEQYLNGYGYSLRSGPPNLGVILKLKHKKPYVKDEPPLAKKTLFDPTIFERSGKLRISRVGVEQTERSRTRAQVEVQLPKSTAVSGKRVLLIAPKFCPCVECETDQPKDSGQKIDSGTHLCGWDPKTGVQGWVDANGVVHPDPTCQSQNEAISKTTVSKGQSCGDNLSKCQLAPNLYKGIVGGKLTGVGYCSSASNGNDWFDASICAQLDSTNCGGDGKLSLSNDESLNLDLKIFGVELPVIDAAVEASYENGNPQQDFHFNFLGQEIKPINFSQDVPGPGAVIPLVEPFNLVISTNLHFGFDASPQFTMPTIAPPDPSKSGTLGADAGLTVNSSISLEAKLDAIVASAGVDAQLVLVNDYLGVGVDSLISPAANMIKVTPGVKYRLDHLHGHIYLFVEVDLLVTTKRWEIEILNLDSGLGTHGLTETAPFTTETYRAVTKKSAGF